MAEGTFVTAINCMDGRVQEPVIAWMKNTFKADYVDMITEAGPDGILANGPYQIVGAIIDRLKVSINAHGSSLVAVVAHADCAGNPVPRAEHMRQLTQSIELVRSFAPDVRVIGLWVNSRFKVQLIHDDGDVDPAEDGKGE